MFALSDDGGAKCLSADSSSPKTHSSPTHTFPVFKHRIYREKKKKENEILFTCQHVNSVFAEKMSAEENRDLKRNTYEDESEDWASNLYWL